MQRHTACAAVLLLGGCASPYVQLEHRDKIDDVRPAALAEAIADARAVEARYRDKVIELGEAERSLSNGLLGIGTAVVGMGVAKVHPSTITGTALLGGSVYTIGTFNTDKRRAQAYVAGMKALDCAVATVTPLVLDDRQIAQLKTDREAVSQSVGEVSGAIGEAERWSARARAGDDAARFEAALAAVTQGIAAAQAAVSKGDEAIDLATQRLDKPQRIAADLRSAVSSIDSAVLEEIRGTENAVQSVPAVLATLQANA